MADSAPGAVLLDVDGTLVDTNYLHVHAWVQAFIAAGHPVDAWRVHRAIGMGGSQLLAELLGDDADRLGERATEGHTARYAELAPLMRVLPGARELVRALAVRGARVVLATSAAPEEVTRLRAVLDLEDVLHDVTSSKDVDAAKPEPDLVHVALRAAGVEADEAVFVGDSVWDAVAAGRAGVTCVGLRSGGVSAAELREAGAVEVYDDPEHLLRELDRSRLATVLA
jgi:HAD superfamily hydrolase (TIGR01509 family)